MKQKHNIFIMLKFNTLQVNTTFYSKIGKHACWWIKINSKSAKTIQKKSKVIDIPDDFLVLIERSTDEKIC